MGRKHKKTVANKLAEAETAAASAVVSPFANKFVPAACNSTCTVPTTAAALDLVATAASEAATATEGGRVGVKSGLHIAVSAVASSDSTASANLAAAAASAAVDAAVANCPAALWLLSCCGALDAASWARAGLASRPFLDVAQALGRRRIHLSLAETQLWEDAEMPGQQPQLAISHLESMTGAHFLFSATRALLRIIVAKSKRSNHKRPVGSNHGSTSVPKANGLSVHFGWLMEVGGEAGACKTIAAMLLGGTGDDAAAEKSESHDEAALSFPEDLARADGRSHVVGNTTNVNDAATDTRENTSSADGPSQTAVAAMAERIGEMIQSYEAHTKWSNEVLEVISRLGHDAPLVLQNTGIEGHGSKALHTLLIGIGELLPSTNSAVAAQNEKPVRAAIMFCQLLERLLYPTREARLVLHAACRVGSATVDAEGIRTEWRTGRHPTAEFGDTISADDSFFEVLMFAAVGGGKHYVVMFEYGLPRTRAVHTAEFAASAATESTALATSETDPGLVAGNIARGCRGEDKKQVEEEQDSLKEDKKEEENIVKGDV